MTTPEDALRIAREAIEGLVLGPFNVSPKDQAEADRIWIAAGKAILAIDSILKPKTK